MNSCAAQPSLIPGTKDVHKLYSYKKCTGKEMRLTAQIGDYEMDQVILDLGSDANILPKKTWQRMGEPKLEWSTIQLRMENQQKIIPLGRLPKVVVDIAGVKVLADFDVIEIMEDADPYPALLGLDWAIDVGGFINLKKRSMVFEKNGTCIVVPLDPTKGVQQTEPTYAEEELDHIYRVTTQGEDQGNPTTGKVLFWEKDQE